MLAPTLWTCATNLPLMLCNTLDFCQMPWFYADGHFTRPLTLLGFGCWLPFLVRFRRWWVVSVWECLMRFSLMAPVCGRPTQPSGWPRGVCGFGWTLFSVLGLPTWWCAWCRSCPWFVSDGLPWWTFCVGGGFAPCSTWDLQGKNLLRLFRGSK